MIPPRARVERVRRSAFELRVASEEPVLIEGESSFGAQIFLDLLEASHGLDDADEVRDSSAKGDEALRKGVGQSFVELKHGEVHVSHRVPQDPGPPGACRGLFEVAEVFGHARLEEVVSRAFRFFDLVLEIQARADGVMSVVDLGDEVGDGELELMSGVAGDLGLTDQAEPRSHVREDVGCVRDEPRSVAEDRRGKDRGAALVLQDFDDRLGSAARGFWAARHVFVGSAYTFESEAHEFTPSLNARPIEELVRISFDHSSTYSDSLVAATDFSVSQKSPTTGTNEPPRTQEPELSVRAELHRASERGKRIRARRKR